MTSAKLVPVEYYAIPGSGIRRKFKQLDRSRRLVVRASVLSAPFLIVVFCLHTGGLPLLLVGLLAFLCLGAAAVLVSGDEIYIGEHGLSFPLPFMFSLSMRPTRLWTELERLQVISQTLQEDSPQAGATTIRLTFSSGERVDLALQKFSADSINLFVGAAAEWATHCKFDQQFEQLPKIHEYESGNIKSISYTQFWEEQLANTYTFTAFVPLQVGHRLRSDTLTVLSQIASGGFSAIYLVKSTDGKRMVAKESVAPATLDAAAKEKIREQFNREASLLVKLEHPAIAQVYDHFVEAGRSYLLIEYIAGPDLRAYIRQHGAQSEPVVRDWLNQMAAVLAYLHKQEPPIVHRDISPENIIVSEGNKLVLIDFGAANEFIGKATGTLVGKQSYISPEQIRGKACPQSDIYSLGAAMFFAATANDPEPLSCSNLIAAGADISTQLDQLISACTKLDLAQRIKSAEDLQRELTPQIAAVKNA